MRLFDGMTARTSAIRLQEFDIIYKAETSNRVPASPFALRSFGLRGYKSRHRLDMNRGIRRTIDMQLVEPDGPPAAGGLVEDG